MDQDHHSHHTHPQSDRATGGLPSLNRTAWSATVHCLTGCAIGEVLGMVIGTALAWGNGATVVVSVVLAFFFGYLLTLRPLLRQMRFAAAAKLALASDTVSIIVMETVDNAAMLTIPGAMDAGLATVLFWASLAFTLVLAGLVAFPVNRWLISRGKGHALVHVHHN